jgi:glutamate-1-semialdehyde 2,1-aminomutase|tara:strand:- start:26862 stop:28151 length:1290 start_codon:yes stop_codon:yes gene_type:complete
MSQRYLNSEKLLKRALESIPLGSQTFSKSLTQYPFGSSPYFIQRGEGSRVWDVDGNCYIDFINSLLAITLGYGNEKITNAVQTQLHDGVIFSLPHILEMEVAELICEMVPCAEKVRFGKNGSDATSGAIRLARAYTKRDHVAVCGYHGWQDWYIGSTARNDGVPQAVRELTHSFPYNDLNALDTLLRSRKGEFAAVILEPMNLFWPAEGYLEGVKELVHQNGAVLIFDETITGFRFANGGAQEYFNVTPDLATFGKGLANGFPISAIAGSNEIMKLMEEVFFSFTFGGETLSLAAAKACLSTIQNEPVIDTIAIQGTKVKSGLNNLIDKYNAHSLLSVAGHPSWSLLIIQDTELVSSYGFKTLYLQEMLARGILTFGSHNMSYAHSDHDIQLLLDAYDEVIPMLLEARNPDKLKSMLNCEILKPLFKVR